MKFRAFTAVTLILFTGLIGVYSTPAMAELIPPPTEEPQPTPGDWMPYVPNSALVDLVSTADQWASVNVTLWLTGCVVSDWGTLEQDGNDFWVDTQIWQYMGLVIQVVIPESHIYDLGYLEAGNYTFTFKAWGIDVKSVSFTVPTTAAESIPTTEVFYGDGCQLFEQGIYVIATETNPVEMYQDYIIFINYYYKMLKEHVTTEASTEDFISILVSRGRFSTGGYWMEIKSIEKMDYAFVLNASFTDPGPGAVTQVLTNPIALIPIGNLPAGEYSITLYIYRGCHDFVEETWTATFKCSAGSNVVVSNGFVLETDKAVYARGEWVNITFTNYSNEIAYLTSWPSFEIYDSQGNYVAPTILAFCCPEVSPRESHSWTWDQRTVNSTEAPAGNYTVILKVYNSTTPWTLAATLFISFEIVEPEVIPEFPTWTSMLLILIVLTFATVIYKRRLLKTPIH